MSSTHGGIDPTNLYTTPSWATDAILPHVPIGGGVVDAGCGEGAILARVASVGRHWTRLIGVEIDAARADVANERLRAIRPGAPITIVSGDWLKWGESEPRVDLAIFNPPFVLAEDFISHAIELTARSHGTVAALLRYNWPVPACRASFVKKHPFDVGWLPRRPDFVASLKCKDLVPTKAERAAGASVRKACTWKRLQPIDAARPKACPECGHPVSVCTTDSADYGWFIFGPRASGRCFPLDVPESSRSRALDLRKNESEVTP